MIISPEIDILEYLFLKVKSKISFRIFDLKIHIKENMSDNFFFHSK